jgi:hypothetical protein
MPNWGPPIYAGPPISYLPSSSTFAVSGHPNVSLSETIYPLPLTDELMITKPPHREIVVRFHAGLSSGNESHDYHGGHIPSFAFWEPNGEHIVGTDYSSAFAQHMDQGSFVEIPTGHGLRNKRKPGYMLVTGQVEDAICLAGVEYKYTGSGREERNLLLGDVGKLCGMPWYHSRKALGNPFHRPACVWMTTDCLKRPARTPGEGGLADYGGDQTDPPAGFSFHLDSFFGDVVNEAVAKQRNDDRAFMCGHEARFKVWWDDRKVDDEVRVPVFKNQPLPKSENMMDLHNFTSEPWEPSKKLKGDIADLPHFDDTIIECEFALFCWRWRWQGLTWTDDFGDDFHGRTCGDTIEPQFDVDAGFLRRKRKIQRRMYDDRPHRVWARETLVKDEESARELCESKTSMGADWYSHSEELFCHMASKTLFPACKDAGQGKEAEEDCFDVELNQVREKPCGEGGLCGRAAKAGVAGKVYKRVEDSRATETQ